MTRSPLRCCTSIIWSSALVQASSSLSIGRTCAWPRRLPVTEICFAIFRASIPWFWLPIFPTNLLRSKKVMKFQNKGAVLVQIAPLLISQPTPQPKSVYWRVAVWQQNNQQKEKGEMVCSISLFFDYMCMCLPLSPWSIAGVPSSQALPDFLITHHLWPLLM